MGVQVRINRTTVRRTAQLLAAKDLTPIAHRALAQARSNAPKETGTMAANLRLLGPIPHGNSVLVQIGIFHSAPHPIRFSGEDPASRPSIAQVLVFVESTVKPVTGKKMRWRAYHNNQAPNKRRRKRKGIPENEFLIKATARLMTRYRGAVRDLTN